MELVKGNEVYFCYPEGEIITSPEKAIRSVLTQYTPYIHEEPEFFFEKILVGDPVPITANCLNPVLRALEGIGFHETIIVFPYYNEDSKKRCYTLQPFINAVEKPFMFKAVRI